MHQAEIVVFLLALVVVAQKLDLPYPVVLVLAGLGLSFVPRLPENARRLSDCVTSR